MGASGRRSPRSTIRISGSARRLTAALTGGSLPVLAAAADNVERWLEARWPDNVHVERILTSIDDLCE